jgi:hypothetical protein
MKAGGCTVPASTQAAYVFTRMFAGHIQQQTVISDQPVVVVDGDNILSSFSGVKEATQFLKRVKSDTARIFRHNGSNWDRCKTEPVDSAASQL